MKRFLRNILIFSILTLLLLGAGELVVRSLPTSYSYKAEWMDEHSESVGTLILGSSHTYYGLRPDLLGDSVFNLANVSQTPEYDLILLKKYLPKMPGLRRVIIPISYFTYRDPVLEEDEWKLAIRYKTQMGLDIHSDLSRYNFEISDFDAYTGKLKSLVFESPSNRCDSLGFGLGYDLKHRASHWKERSGERAAKHTRTTPGRFREVLAVQRELLRLAREHDIEVVFVTTPGWKDYVSAFDCAQYAEMRQGVRQLLRESTSIGVKVSYYDFLTDHRFTDPDFYDPDHLTDRGASRLTRLLADTLRHSSHR